MDLPHTQCVRVQAHASSLICYNFRSCVCVILLLTQSHCIIRRSSLTVGLRARSSVNTILPVEVAGLVQGSLLSNSSAYMALRIALLEPVLRGCRRAHTSRCSCAVFHRLFLCNELHDLVEVLNGLGMQFHLDLVFLAHLFVLQQDLLELWAILVLILPIHHHISHVSLCLLGLRSGKG